MSESPPPYSQSKVLREAQAKIKQLEEEISFLSAENEELKKKKEGEIIEYYYVLDAEDTILTGFFKKLLPKKS